MSDELKIKTESQIIDLLQQTNREGIDEIINWLKTSDFFIAPASTQYHLSEEGGLAFHSLSVYKTLKNKLAKDNTIFGDVNEDTAILVALLHDVCKIDMYEKYMKNVKDDVTGKWNQEPAFRFNDQNPLGHGEKSVIQLMLKGLKLTEEEIYAIRWHMGAFDTTQNEANAYGNAIEKYPLVLALHEADNESSHIIESKFLDSI